MKVLLVSEGVHEGFGALEILVRRAVPKIRECVWRPISDRTLETHKGKGQGVWKRALRWILVARKEKYDALVLVLDQDKFQERINDIDRAQAEQIETNLFPRALGVAVRSFDAWMLADEKALSSVLGVMVQTQPSPEENSDPKSSCAALLSQSTCEIRPRELYAQVAQTLDLRRLEERCPKGFSVFADRLRSL